MYAWGLYPLFGTGNLFPKKVGPKKIIQDKFGYSPPCAPQTGILVMKHCSSVVLKLNSSGAGAPEAAKPGGSLVQEPMIAYG